MIKKLKNSIAFLLIMCLFIQGTNCFVFAEDKSAPTQTVQQTMQKTVSLKTQDGRNFAIPAGVYFIPGIGEVLIEATGAIIVAGAVIAVGSWIYNTIVDWLTSFFSNPSDKIDWGKGDHGHIVRGTDNKHFPEFKKFGLDPKKPDDDNWWLLLPFLKDTVNNADKVTSEVLKSGGKVYYYTKNYADKGVELLVKIFQHTDGTLVPSDAWPVK